MNHKLAFAAAALLLARAVWAQAPSPATPPPAKAPASSGPAPSSSAAAVDPAKAAAVKQLMEVTGSNKIGDELIALLTSQVKQAVGTEITDQTRLNSFMDAFSKGFATHVTASQINDAVLPIYAQHLSLEDIQALVAFYQSTPGQHVIKALPLIIQESQTTGANMARPAALDTLRQMSTDYPEIAPLLPPTGASSQGVQPNATPARPGSPPSLREIPAPATPPATAH